MLFLSTEARFGHHQSREFLAYRLPLPTCYQQKEFVALVGWGDFVVFALDCRIGKPFLAFPYVFREPLAELRGRTLVLAGAGAAITFFF